MRFNIYFHICQTTQKFCYWYASPCLAISSESKKIYVVYFFSILFIPQRSSKYFKEIKNVFLSLKFIQRKSHIRKYISFYTSQWYEAIFSNLHFWIDGHRHENPRLHSMKNIWFSILVIFTIKIKLERLGKTIGEQKKKKRPQ